MKLKKKIINLFNDKEISSIKHVISIGSEEDLNQFWDFSTNSNSVSYELIHTFVANFYNFAIMHIRDNSDEFFNIILEESDENFYFTLWNKKISLSFEESMKESICEYLQKKNRITIRLDKSKYLKKVQNLNKKNLKRQKNLLNPKLAALAFFMAVFIAFFMEYVGNLKKNEDPERFEKKENHILL